MATSTGSETSAVLQYHLDTLMLRCMSCTSRERQAAWDAGLALILKLPGIDADRAAFQDAVQDAGFQLGIFHINAKTARFYGQVMGPAEMVAPGPASPLAQDGARVLA